MTHKKIQFLILTCYAFLLLFALSCEDKKINDCAEVEGGAAQIDSCGLCTGGTTGVIANSSKDVLLAKCFSKDELG